MTLPRLTADEQRVLGCLLEKEVTVPDTYPLTLNALRSACNQKSSRDPIVDFDERTVQDAVRALKDGGLARVTWADYGRRTLKYLQTATHLLGLGQQDHRWIHLLGDPPPDAAPAAEDRESILAGGPAERDAAVVAGYAASAAADTSGIDARR